MKKRYCKLNKSYNFNCGKCPHYDGYVVCKDFVRRYEQPNPDMIMNPLQKKIMGILSKEGGLNRNELGEFLGKIPRTTIYDNLSGLIINNYVVKEKLPLNNRGRPQVIFKKVYVDGI